MIRADRSRLSFAHRSQPGFEPSVIDSSLADTSGGSYVHRLLTAYSFGGVEGLECLSGGVVVGVGAEGCADAVAVELLAHRAEDGGNDEADVPLVSVFDDRGEDCGCGVVDVSDGRAVEHYPAQRAAVADQAGDVVEESEGVGVVEAGAEPVDHQPFLGPGTWGYRGGLPVPGG